MNITVTEVKTTKKGITISGIDIEAMLCYDALDEAFEAHIASFFFPYGDENVNAQKYLLKVLFSCPACKGCATPAEMLHMILEKGASLYLSDNFRIK